MDIDCFVRQGFKVAVLLVGTASLVGCPAKYYTPNPQILPQHVRKLAIRPFINETQQFGLEDKLTLRVVDEFLRDGRFPVVNEENADGVVAGAIKRYILEPLSYDANQVAQQFKLWVLVDVYFYDRATKETLWKESNMEGVHRFFAKTVDPINGLTEEEAREVIWDKLARDIGKRTIEGFGAGSGTSERLVPKREPPSTTAPSGQPGY
ncbi:MAG: LptE family protein [Elusimicrobia bacterium]|nr:LptE family protein [Elusimicrobiota bacterium]